MSGKILFSSKLALALLLLFAAFMTNLKYQQWKSEKAIEKEKQNMMAQIDALEKNSKDLKESLDYLNSKNFTEREARGQMNLKRNGELVYNFVEGSKSEGDSQETEKKSNYQKWWDYFTRTTN